MRAPFARRPGMSLIELIVALLLVAIGLLAVAAAALLAQRTMLGAAATERITRDVATIADSLAVHPEPASGERAAAGRVIRWTVHEDSLGDWLWLDATALAGPRPVRLTFETRHAAR